MNIAIITWFGGPNAGTFFQLYGLYGYVKSRGHHVEVINYKPNNDDFLPKGFSYYLKNIVGIVRKKIRAKISNHKYEKILGAYGSIIERRRAKFAECYKEILFTEPVKTDDDFANLLNRFDCFIVGSDQIWNSSMLNKRYLLNFVDGNEKIKAAYCPSVGTGQILKHQRMMYKQYLSDFSYIATREKALKEVLCEELNIPVEHLLDPSMLVSREQYLEMAVLPNQFEGKRYLLCYFMPSTEFQRNQLRELAKENGLEIVSMAMHHFSYEFEGATIYAEAGPREFLGLIANATIVCSSSFHCTIFSILFHKDIYVFQQQVLGKSGDTNIRYTEQLESYGMNHRFVHWNEKIGEMHKMAIDYDKAEQIFQKRLKDSYSFLNQFI